MAKDKINAKTPGNNGASTASPSGMFNIPTKVALDGSMLGQGNSSLDELIGKAIGAVCIGGDKGGSIKGVTDLAKSAKQGIIPTLEDIVTNVNNIYKQNDNANKLKLSKIENIYTLLKGAYNDSLKTFRIEQQLDKDKEKTEESSNSLNIILSSTNLPDILNKLMSISGDESVYNLNTLIAILDNLNIALSNISNNNIDFSNLSSELNALTNINAEPLLNFIKDLNDFNNKLNITLDTNQLESEILKLNNLLNISLNIDDIDVSIDKNIVNKINNELYKINDSINFDLDTTKFDINESINNAINFKLDSNIITNITNELESVNKALQYDFNLDELKINDKINNALKLELDENIISSFDTLKELLDKISLFKTVKAKISTSQLKSVIENLSSLNNFSGIKINIKGEDIESIKSLSGIINAISELKNLKSVTKKTKRLEDAITALSKIDLSKIKIDKQKINELNNFLGNKKGIITTLKSLEELDLDWSKIHAIKNNINKLASIVDEINTINDADVALKTIDGILKIFEKINLTIEAISIKNILLGNVKFTNVLLFSELLVETFEELAKIKSDQISKIPFGAIKENIETIYSIMSSLKSVEELQQASIKLPFYFKFITEVGKINTGLKDLITDDVINVEPIITNITELNKLAYYFSSIKSLSEDEIMDKIIVIHDISLFIPNLINVLNNVDLSELKGPQDMSLLMATISSIVTVCKDINKVENVNVEEAIGNVKNTITKIFSDSDSLLNVILGIEIKEEDMKKLKGGFGQVSEIINNTITIGLVLALFGIISPFALVGIYTLKIFIKQLAQIIIVLQGIDQKELAQVNNIVSSISDLLLKATLSMIIGGLIITAYPDIIFGALKFMLVFGAFLISVGVALGIASHVASEKAKKSMDSFHGIILSATTIMLIGGLFMMIPGLVQSSLMFGVVFALFLTTILLPLTISAAIISLCGGKPVKNEKGEVEGGIMGELYSIIGSAAAVMIIGSLFMMIPGLAESALTFTVVLGLFLAATLIPIVIAASIVKGMNKEISALTTMILGATLLLVIGGSLVIYRPDIILGAIGFAIILGVFLTLVIKGISWAAKDLKNTFAQLAGLTLIIAVSGMLIMFAASIITDWNTVWFILSFVGVLLLLVGGISLIINQLMKDIKLKTILNAMIIMAGIGALMYIAGKTFKILGDIANNTNLGKLLKVSAIFVVVLGTMTAIAAAFISIGMIPGVGPASLAAAAAVLVGIGVMMYLTANAIKIMIESMDLFAKVKPIDFSVLLNNIGGIMLLGTAMGALGVISPLIILGAGVIRNLTNAISSISETVADIASLKIPLYDGTKRIGYRQLTNNDFKTAGENVKTIVSVLVNAFCDVYKSNPKAFSFRLIGDSPINRVIDACKNMGEVIGDIAHGVKTYASLKIPIYNGTKISGYRQLTDNDFSNAASNVNKIISTLGRAIVDTYNLNPELFETPSILGIGVGKTKFDKVLSSTSKLGSVISGIAKGLQAYAKLGVPEYKDGKIVSYTPLDQSKIDEARTNVALIISTLGKAIVDTYNLNPELFETPSILGIGIGKTKFDKVLGSASKIGSVISSIAKGLQAWAKMGIPEYNDKGKIIKYDTTKFDVNQAKQNITEVISALALAVNDVYEKNKELFDDTNWLTGTTKFAKVLKSSIKLGDMVSNIAKGLQQYAKLGFPNYNSKGKIIGYDRMTANDISNAAQNIQEVLSIMGDAIIGLYDKRPELFKGSGLFGNGKTKFDKVLQSSLGIGKLISSISSGLRTYSKLQFATNWDTKTGKATEFVKLAEADISQAGKNIGIVITKVAESVIEVYNKNKHLFEEPSGKFFGKGDGKFDKIVKSFRGLGSLMKDIAKGLQGYSKLEFDGKKLSPGDIATAGTHINTVITKIAESVINTYKDNPTMFAVPKNGLFGSGDSTFDIVMRSMTGLGSLLKDVASALQSYSKLEFNGVKITSSDIQNVGKNIGDMIVAIVKPIGDLATNNETKHYFEDSYPNGLYECLGVFSTGNPIVKVMGSLAGLGTLLQDVATAMVSYSKLEFGSKKLSNTDIENAESNIGTVVKTIAESICTLYKENPQLFAPVDDKNTVFGKVMLSMNGLGNLVSNIAMGVSEFARMQFGSNIKLEPSDLKAAADNIGDVINVLGNTFIEIYKKDTNGIFTDDTITTVNEGWFNTSTETKTQPGSSPFAKIINALGGLGSIVSNIALGLKDYASLKFGDKKLSETDMKNAASVISSVISLMGNTIASIDTTNISSEKSQAIVSGISAISTNISSIATGIALIAKGEIPTGFDKDGKPINVVTLTNDEMKTAAKTIGEICGTLVTAFAESSKSMYKYHNINSTVETLNKISGAIVPISSMIHIYGKGLIPLEVDKDNKVINSEPINFDTASENITKVLNALITPFDKGFIDTINNILGNSQNLFDNVYKLIDKLPNIAKNLYYYSIEQIPVTEGTKTSYKSINFDTASANIKKVISAIGNAVTGINVTKESDKIKAVTESVIPSMNSILGLLQPLAKSLYAYSSNKVIIKDENGKEKEVDIDFDIAKTQLATSITAIGDALAITLEKNWNKLNTKSNGMFSVLNAFLSNAKLLSDGMEHFSKLTNVNKALGENIGSFIYEFSDKIADIIDEWNWNKLSSESEVYFTLLNNYLTNASGLYVNISKLVTKGEIKTDVIFTNMENVSENVEEFYDTYSKLYSFISKANLFNNIITCIKNISLANTEIINLSKNNEQVINLMAITNLAQLISKIKTDLINSDNNSFKDKDINSISKIVSRINTVITKITNAANNINGIIEKLSLLHLSMTKVNDEFKLVESATSIKSTVDSANEIMASINTDLSVMTNIKSYITQFNTIVDSLNTIKSLDSSLSSNMSDISVSLSQLNNISKTINTVLSNEVKVKQTAENANGKINENNIDIPIIGIVNSIKNKLNSFDTSEFTSSVDKIHTAIKNAYTKLNNIGSNDNDNTVSLLKTFTSDLSELFTTMSLQETTIFLSNSSNITTGIDNISKSLTNATSDAGTQNIKKHNAELKNYITTINSIKVESINSITNMINALLKLGVNMGNMDKLAKAISEHLSVALSEVKSVIDDFNANYKQEIKQKNLRQQNIDNSLNTVKRLMEKKMQVEVLNNGKNSKKPGTSPGSTGWPSTPTGEGDESSKNNSPQKPSKTPPSPRK